MLSGKLFHFPIRHGSSNILLLLTDLGTYWENIALSLSCTDLASLDPYQKDPGQYSPSTALVIIHI